MRVFINYRRGDSIATAGRLHDHIGRAFGRANVFMDVDHIPAGVDFVDHLREQVAACDVFLALIGKSWLDARDDAGNRRLDDPNDFVVIEIATALTRDIPVIPVLIDDTRMPDAGQLPEALKALARRNAVEVRNAQFGVDARRLVDKVRAVAQPRLGVSGMWPVAVLVVAVLAVGAWIARGQFIDPAAIVPHPPGPTTILAAPPIPAPASPAQPLPSLPKSANYCDGLKTVVAAHPARFESVLGRTFGDTRIARIPLDDWEDCVVFMESRWSDKRRYNCKLTGLADLRAAEQATERIAEDMKAGCLGPKWSIGRGFDTEGQRRLRLVDENSDATITLRPSRSLTAPTWGVQIDVD